MECEILDVAKAGQLVDQTEQSPKSAFLMARKEQIYSRAVYKIELPILYSELHAHDAFL